MSGTYFNIVSSKESEIFWHPINKEIIVIIGCVYIYNHGYIIFWYYLVISWFVVVIIWY